MAEIVFQLKSDKIIGSLSLPVWSFSYAIQETMDLVKNFNQNLANSPLAGGPFAVRFFEKDVAKPVIMEDSREYLEKSFPGFVLRHKGECDERWGSIAVINSDMEKQIATADQIVVINFDMRWVAFMHTYQRYEALSWETWENKPANELNECPYDFNCIPFNELEDVYQFVSENQSGWILPGDPSHVFVPRTAW